MKKALTRQNLSLYYYVNDIKMTIDPNDISTFPTGISGDLSEIRGNLSGIRGNLSEISGDLSEIRGDLLGISGDLEDCEITEEDRKKGIDIKELIEKD